MLEKRCVDLWFNLGLLEHSNVATMVPLYFKGPHSVEPSCFLVVCSRAVTLAVSRRLNDDSIMHPYVARVHAA